MTRVTYGSGESLPQRHSLGTGFRYSAPQAKLAEAVDVDASLRAQVTANEQRLSASGYRVMAVASRDVGPDVRATQEACECELVLEGFLCLEDPLRDEVPPAVASCREAGIDIVLITGDHPETARAVAAQAGIVPRRNAAPSAHGSGQSVRVRAPRTRHDGFALAPPQRDGAQPSVATAPRRKESHADITCRSIHRSTDRSFHHWRRRLCRRHRERRRRSR